MKSLSVALDHVRPVLKLLQHAAPQHFLHEDVVVVPYVGFLPLVYQRNTHRCRRRGCMGMVSLFLSLATEFMISSVAFSQLPISSSS
eukprot:13552346-Heterocapsa_arctica.AAC.1